LRFCSPAIDWWLLVVTPETGIASLLDNGATALVIGYPEPQPFLAHNGRLFPPFPRFYDFQRRTTIQIYHLFSLSQVLFALLSDFILSAKFYLQ